MDNVCPHSFGCFQSLEEVHLLLHEVTNFSYHLEATTIIMKQEAKGKMRKITSEKETNDLPFPLFQK